MRNPEVLHQSKSCEQIQQRTEDAAASEEKEDSKTGKNGKSRKKK